MLSRERQPQAAKARTPQFEALNNLWGKCMELAPDRKTCSVEIKALFIRILQAVG